MMYPVDMNIEKRNLSEQLFEHIRDLILSEQLKGGERIPEIKIAAAFGVSRTPIREALRKLEKFGLVQLFPRSHAIVVEIDENDSKFVTQVRLQIETASAKLLAEKANEEDCEAIAKYVLLCARSAKMDDLAACFKNDSLLHLEIAKRSGNPYFYSIMQTMDAKIQLLRTKYCTNIEKVRYDLKAHDLLLDAICSNNANIASEVMRNHILKSHSILHSSDD